MQVVNSCCLILIMAWCGRLVFVVCLSQPAAQPPHTHPSNPQPSQPCGEGSYESVHEASGWHNMSCAHAPPRYTRPRMNGEKCTSVGELSHQRDRAKAGVRDAIRAGGAPLPPHAEPADAPPPPIQSIAPCLCCFRCQCTASAWACCCPLLWKAAAQGSTVSASLLKDLCLRNLLTTSDLLYSLARMTLSSQ